MKRSCWGLALLLFGITSVCTAQPETAPPPREKQTPAELLVGRWRLVKFGEKPVPNTSTDHLTFTAKGRYISTYSRPTRPAESVSGRYQLVGKAIELTTEPPSPPITDQVTIVEITKDRLVIQHGEVVSFRRSEYVRDQGK